VKGTSDLNARYYSMNTRYSLRQCNYQ